MLLKYTEKLSEVFYDKTQISLFKQLPNKEIENIKYKKDIDKDVLVSRLNDLSNFIDRIDKKEIDKFCKQKSEGSKKTLINVLKFLFKDLHDEINNIDENLDLIFLLRAYYTHGKNRNIKIAFEKLNINEDNPSFEEIWNKVLLLFEEILLSIISLFETKHNEIIQAELDTNISNLLLNNALNNNSHILKDKYYEKYILHLIYSKNIIDKSMAKDFNISINQLRTDLLALHPTFLKIDFNDYDSCKISIKDIFKEKIIEYYKGKNDET